MINHGQSGLGRKIALGAGLAILSLTGIQATAEAKPKHWHHGHGVGIYIGTGFGHGYGYGRSCRWLKRKAIHTGSKYWWRQYRHCRWSSY